MSSLQQQKNEERKDTERIVVSAEKLFTMNLDSSSPVFQFSANDIANVFLLGTCIPLNRLRNLHPSQQAQEPASLSTGSGTCIPLNRLRFNCFPDIYLATGLVRTIVIKMKIIVFVNLLVSPFIKCQISSPSFFAQQGIQRFTECLLSYIFVSLEARYVGINRETIIHCINLILKFLYKPDTKKAGCLIGDLTE